VESLSLTTAAADDRKTDTTVSAQLAIETRSSVLSGVGVPAMTGACAQRPTTESLAAVSPSALFPASEAGEQPPRLMTEPNPLSPVGDGDIHQLRVAAPPLRVEGPHSPRPEVESLAPMSLAAAFRACGEGANPTRAAHESHPTVPLAAASPVCVEGVLPSHATVAVPLATESLPRPTVESLVSMPLAAAFPACGEGANPSRAAHKSHPTVPLAAASPVCVEGVLSPHAIVAVPLAIASPADVSLSGPAGAPLPSTVVAAVAGAHSRCIAAESLAVGPPSASCLVYKDWTQPP
jgi:hypothetical protein